MASESAVVTGALGAVLGYLGGEVAEETAFERLLWPQRFYNYMPPSVALRQGLFMTMGGPIHAAALSVLDVFRKHGLYRGSSRGHFLGTAFYPDMEDAECRLRSPVGGGEKTASLDKAVRNGLWVEVSRRVDHSPQLRGLPRIGSSRSGKLDTESTAGQGGTRIQFRAVQVVHHIILRLLTPKEDEKTREEAVGRKGMANISRVVIDNEVADEEVVWVTEEHRTWRAALGILCSEVVGIVAAVVAAAPLQCWWLSAYMLVPLLLKYAALAAGVQREGLMSRSDLEREGTRAQHAGEPSSEALNNVEAFEVSDPGQDFLVIEGPAPVVLQFFRHYGHPLRDGRWHRVREVASMCVVYAFVLYFPAGLVANIWMPSEVQYLWLAYQLYAVLAMHVVRLVGWQGCGRTEDRVAALLGEGKSVCLYDDLGGEPVVASLRTTFVPNAASGQEMVRSLTGSWRLKEKHVDSVAEC